MAYFCTPVNQSEMSLKNPEFLLLQSSRRDVFQGIIYSTAKAVFFLPDFLRNTELVSTIKTFIIQ